MASSLDPKPAFLVGGSFMFVKQWLHLGHLDRESSDDTADITNRRDYLCSNKQLTMLVGHVTKQPLVYSFCNSFYGRVFLDLDNAMIQDLCATWRKGVRRVWGLPLYNVL